MSGRQAFTQEKIKDQLNTVECLLDYYSKDFIDHYYWKWWRHYLLKRLLTLQLKEFDK